MAKAADCKSAIYRFESDRRLFEKALTKILQVPFFYGLMTILNAIKHVAFQEISFRKSQKWKQKQHFENYLSFVAYLN